MIGGMMRHIGLVMVLPATGALAAAAQTNVTIHVNGTIKVERLTAHYRCDASGVELGLPAGVFAVQYVRAGESSLAVVPVKGNDLIFAQVLAATGGRYTAARYQWWDGRETTFTLDPDARNPKRSTCTSVD
jgi:membrane-bound inhibitor of C-type lysozyme